MTVSARLINPYWDEVHEHVVPSDCPDEPGLLVVGKPPPDKDWSRVLDRHALVARYSWTITDPETVEFVTRHADDGVIDPMAGTGYWAYVLGQLGVDIVCYDLSPDDNRWHGGSPVHVPVTGLDAVEAVTQHPDRTLLLSWPPYSTDIGARVLKAYQGSRVIFFGEDSDGCTGDTEMYTTFDREWTPVATHIPIQWYLIHDSVTVFVRNK
jgi:hypothetical protein